MISHTFLKQKGILNMTEMIEKKLNNKMRKEEGKVWVRRNPVNRGDPPISVNIKANRLPIRQLERGSTGKLPIPSNPARTVEKQEEEVTLIPYGCTTLRISEFPVH